MKGRPDWFYNQSAVVPFKKDDGKLKVLLITSRKKKKWIIPKGVIKLSLSPQDSAEKEASEEAGVEGEVYEELMGEYKKSKWGGTVNIQVFPMKVTSVLSEWEEDNERKRKWYTLEKAVKKVSAKQLSDILKTLPEFINHTAE